MINCFQLCYKFAFRFNLRRYSKADLIRVRANKATMLYVLGDMNADNLDKEDEENIMRGAMLHKLLPQINLRMMLLRPENRQVAADIGLPVYMCFSINEIKSNLMAGAYTRPLPSLRAPFLTQNTL